MTVQDVVLKVAMLLIEVVPSLRITVTVPLLKVVVPGMASPLSISLFTIVSSTAIAVIVIPADVDALGLTVSARVFL